MQTSGNPGPGSINSVRHKCVRYVKLISGKMRRPPAIKIIYAIQFIFNPFCDDRQFIGKAGKYNGDDIFSLTLFM